MPLPVTSVDAQIRKCERIAIRGDAQVRQRNSM
jgi:hypothetical protein